MSINPDDLKIDVYRPATTGMRVGNDHTVRVQHIPTGITITCDTERSQIQNKARCLEMLREELECREL